MNGCYLRRHLSDHSVCLLSHSVRIGYFLHQQWCIPTGDIWIGDKVGRSCVTHTRFTHDWICYIAERRYTSSLYFHCPGVPNAQARCVFVTSFTSLGAQNCVMIHMTSLPLVPVGIWNKLLWQYTDIIRLAGWFGYMNGYAAFEWNISGWSINCCRYPEQ